MTIRKGADGYHHPADEAELIALIQAARAEGAKLRVTGAAHSVSWAIYAERTKRNVVDHFRPPPRASYAVRLDRMRSWTVVDRRRRIIEADAGLHLGAAPCDPDLEARDGRNGLLQQLWDQLGWTLPDLGGVTFQTVGGFFATGSSGGSLTYDVGSAVVGLRLVDGTGTVHDLDRTADPDAFDAALVSMGLLGVITRIRLKCVPAFDITGQEAISTVDDAKVDLFGEGEPGQPPLERFLKDVPYTRLEWWPQRGAERLVVWQAQRVPCVPGFRRVPYLEFTSHPALAELAIDLFYTLIGNLDDMKQARGKLARDYRHLPELIAYFQGLPELTTVSRVLARAAGAVLALGGEALLTVLTPFAPLLKRKLPDMFKPILDVFVPLDSAKKGEAKGQPQVFQDHAYLGLPMDNGASDILLTTAFTEVWLPLGRARDAMNVLRRWFEAAPTSAEALTRTGTFSWELYATRPSTGWMSPSYSDGDDVWKDGVFRIDPYWFQHDEADPTHGFYEGLWRQLREAGIPFRLHWGKYHPDLSHGDPEGWVDFFKGQYPRWDDFLARRAALDPDGVFLTAYWKDHLGL
ncbi:MAG: FAD-binding protein [Alphaproteobacteria bacterium]|nr:FAD-binding protein [Alphaproteobacteria bacterium]